MAAYRIRRATESDKKAIYDIMVSSLFPDMPLFKACSIKEPLGIDVWPTIQNLNDGLSLVAVDNCDVIIGVLIISLPKETSESEKHDSESSHGAIDRFVDFVDKKAKGLLSKLEKTAVELHIIAVSVEHRGKGIAKKLIEEGEKLVKTIGAKKVFAVTTGAYMEAAFKRKNWESTHKYFYAEHANVDPTFKVPPAPHDSLTIFEKHL